LNEVLNHKHKEKYKKIPRKSSLSKFFYNLSLFSQKSLSNVFGFATEFRKKYCVNTYAERETRMPNLRLNACFRKKMS